jgi:hypothetical protein
MRLRRFLSILSICGGDWTAHYMFERSISRRAYKTPHSNISGGTKKQSTKNNKTFKRKKTKKNRRESGKPTTDLFENRPLVGFRFSVYWKPIGFGFGLGFPQGSNIVSITCHALLGLSQLVTELFSSCLNADVDGAVWVYVCWAML